MAEQEVLKNSGWGGAREGAGRPKQDVVRKMRSTRAFDDEWELTKRFLELVKNGYFEECEKFVEELEKK